MKSRLLLLVLVVILFAVACGNQPPVAEVAVVPTTVATSSPETEPSDTPAPTATAENTPTATATETASPTATATATPTATATETSTPTETTTPTETATNTPVPATATPIPPPPTPVPQVPLYPNTPTVAWDLPTFLSSVSQTKDSLDRFYYYFGLVANGQMGSCSHFWGFYATWEGQPAFTDVPSEWRAAYTEYRLILHEIRLTTDPITQVCINQGGTVPPETDQSILAATGALVTRIKDLANSVGAG
ncbi:MAG: hypothetical protein KDE04_13145 [Anaerolineales bacterium]|nr:hypothetical protein [Anaerolineales bacterium]